MTDRDELLDERIRSAVPRYDDSDWRDVRHRAVKKRRPAILAAGLVIAILVAAPAFAFRHQLADLWASAEPDKNLYVRVFADCGAGTFTLEFDPESGATILQSGKTLAHASLTDRQIDCDAPIRQFKGTPDESPWHGDLEGKSTTATAVICETDVELQIAVNPVWYRSEIVGSNVLVSDRRTKRIFASAGMKRDPTDGGRIYSEAHWDETSCSTGK